MSTSVRPASTIMMVRDGNHADAPLEVLMVRRNPRSEFVGGVYVFPGGAVDPSDGGPEAAALCTGRDDASASAMLGLPGGGLAYWVAALRECFEEAGLLLARRSESLLALQEDAEVARFARHRQDMNGRRRSFLDVCREEGLRLPADEVHYFSHWITPEGAPRRFDTRFFVAAAPPEQTPAHDAAETIADRWVRPADALALHREGRIELIFPTIRTLQAIGRCATTDELLATAAAAAVDLAGAPPFLPRLVPDGRGVRIVLPGDPGYDAVAPSPTAGDPAATDRALRAASLAANTAHPPAAPAPAPGEPS